ncbi:uncharacterized protein LOC114352323 isoform X1 [Ostrinia furnacalis]|uniref:uncharacterized protein LOC114352323 isoform X1 n=1 Tax=Ostrinia furnacalis TaxID=93504 RepID=UPI001039B468|nr:uncharacterized protein LOC114352323 isoform X1 [Ostrinia furnacalis]XP_028159712.1 uncharacterized protein LOC114352323 isoform X1 [Ostrinia furnacalis]
MPKRKSDDDLIKRYKNKIKKLEHKKQASERRRRVIIYSDSDTDLGTDDNGASPTTSPQVEILPSTSSDPLPKENADASVSEPAPTEAAADSLEPDPELDPELLLALGDETGSTPIFGEKIHHSLAQRWDPILKKGLAKEAKDKLMKEYLIPENCSLLQAPKLNSEVAAAISEAARQRDKRKETDQQQLGLGTAAINKALTVMLTSDDKIEAIRILSDGCRILTDLHYQQTKSRISVINYSLAKPFLNVVQESERDNTLYGNKLGDKIKASRAIEKQGLSIKKFTKPARSNSLPEPSTTNTRYQYTPAQPAAYQGNWSGPPRYQQFQQNRGGRRGGLRTNAPANRRAPQPASNASGPNKPRTPATRQ